ncbi:MAG: hypothetical protein ABIY52_16295 [Gemmatimonadaceae bacterium]
MALRVFTDPDGTEWNAWLVQPGASGNNFQERFRRGWVCFEQVGGGGRCRLPLDEMPVGWESLADARLDLLRRVADESTTVRLPKHAHLDAPHDDEESRAKHRTLAPKHVIGPAGE